MESYESVHEGVVPNETAVTDTNIGVVTDFKKPYMTELELRRPNEGEIMVKVYTAAVNPSDNYFVIGLYGNPKKFKTLPVGVGFTGAGIVAEVGPGVSEKLIGKKVALNQMPSSPGYIGTYRKYTYMSAKNAYPFPDELSFDDIANAMGANPITIAGFMDLAQRDGHKVFINDAAASSLGKMFNKYCDHHGITLINLVRKQEQVDALKELGAKIVIKHPNKVSEIDDAFRKEMKEVIEKYKPTAFFDAIGGDFPGTVLAMMPAGSTMYVYGGLSNQVNVSVDGGGLIFKNHTVTNFWIPTWIKTAKKETLKQWMIDIVQDLVNGGEIFGTKVSKTFPLSDWDKAMKHALKHATEGKVMIRPQE